MARFYACLKRFYKVQGKSVDVNYSLFDPRFFPALRGEGISLSGATRENWLTVGICPLEAYAL
jgi:hypothetical protein